MTGSSSTDSDRISGWKEIAQYLQRSVRSVQRWEREMGLPVHRIQTLKGQVIYARRMELDAWMTAHESRVSDVKEDPAGDHDAPVTHETVVRRFGWRQAAVVAAASIVVGGGMVVKQMVTPEPSATVKVSGGNVEGRDGNEQPVWTYQFSQPVTRIETVDLGTKRWTDSAADLDLTGDGNLTHLVPLRFGSAAKPAESDALFVFGDDGRVVWSFQPTQILQCASQAYQGPWQLTAVVVSSAPGPKRVWVAFRHHTWWPGFVVELTATGEQSLRYVQAGWIMSLAEWPTTRGSRLVAGGVLNEHRRPSVVLVDTEGPPSLSPAADPQFQCTVQDSVLPDQISLLPTLDVPAAQGHAYPIIHRVAVAARDLVVEVEGSSAIVTFQPDGQAVSYRTSDDYIGRHRALSATGKLDHSVDRCPELLQPREVRQWTPTSQWQTYTLGATAVSQVPQNVR